MKRPRKKYFYVAFALDGYGARLKLKRRKGINKPFDNKRIIKTYGVAILLNEDKMEAFRALLQESVRCIDNLIEHKAKIAKLEKEIEECTKKS